MITISEKIKELRLKNGWTQKEIAEKLSITQAGYQKLESSDSDITFSRLNQIAEIFGMSVVDIINYPNVVGAGVGKEYLLEIERLKERISELSEVVKAQNQDIKNYYIIEFQTFIDYFYFTLIDLDTKKKGIDKATWKEIEAEWHKKVGFFLDSEQIALQAKETPLGIAKLGELQTSIMIFRERLGQTFGYKERPLLERNKESNS